MHSGLLLADKEDPDLHTATVFTDCYVDMKGAVKVDKTNSIRFDSCNFFANIITKFENSTSVRHKNCVRGLFHQGYDQFKYRRVQCMAIALVSLAKHT
ncbi:MAG: hypothetical protein ACRDDA_10255, partial [Aeromonas sp.]